jgi:PAS domain S-box-containing protein
MEELAVGGADAGSILFAAPVEGPRAPRPGVEHRSDTMRSRPDDDVLKEVQARYDALLRGSLEAFDEAALHAAHELGREALARGLGVLDMVELHHSLIARLLPASPPDETVRWSEAAGRLLAESLTPFEMVHRGFRSAHAALQATEGRYRELFENANDAIFTTDLAGRLTSINRAAEELTGYSRDEAMALKLTALMAPAATTPVRLARQAGLNAMEAQGRHELEIVTRDGRRIPIEVSTRQVYQDGQLVGLQGIARDMTDRKNAEAALRHLNEHLEEKVKRIAHALHDEAGQLLASVYLRVAEVASELPMPGRRRVEELRTLLDQVDDQLRRLAHELRPSILDDLGVLPACRFLAEGVSKRSRLQIDVRGSTGGRLPVNIETALYRVVQEALTNVVKHAQAQSVIVQFERHGRRLKGQIRDDGIGFDLASVMNRIGGKGLGLIGMRERLSAVAGRLDITSPPGQGTLLEFAIPLES